MQKHLFVVATIAIAATIVCGFIIDNLAKENSRLRGNQETLLSDVQLYRTKANTSAASVEALELSINEFREQKARDAAMITDLGIRLRRAESYAKSTIQSNYTATTTLSDTIVIRDTIRLFETHDTWHSIQGSVDRDSIRVAIHTIDTLHQVVHRVPHKFLFISYGTKAIRQEVWTSNPHTELVYTEYIELGRRKREKR